MESANPNYFNMSYCNINQKVLSFVNPSLVNSKKSVFPIKSESGSCICLPRVFVIIQMKQRRGVSAQLNNSANSAATQPVNEARSLKRNQQIRALHIEFQDLKRKIRDVESKNEQIRENFTRQPADFKKKPNLDHTAPLVHYDRRHNTIVPTHHASSEEHRDSHRPPSAQNNSKARNNAHHSTFYQPERKGSLQRQRDEEQEQQSSSHQVYRSKAAQPNVYVFSPASQYVIPSQEDIPVSQFAGLPSSPYQYSVQFQPMAVSKVTQGHQQLEEALKRERDKVKVLEEKLEERQDGVSAYKKLQKKYNTMAETYTEVVELCLEDFFQDFVKKKMHQIDKCVKRNEHKLRKLQLGLKDREEDARSRRLIQQHRTHRSHSRNRRENSPKVPSALNNPPRLATRHTTHEPPHDTTKSKLSELSRPSQFQEIAAQYQEIIKVKSKELEESEGRLRHKEAELAEMSARCSKLQLKAHDFAQIPKSKSRRNSEKEDNLLANLVFDSDADTQILQLNKRISQLEQALSVKERDCANRDLALDKSKLKMAEFESKTKRSQADSNRLKEQMKRIERQLSNESHLNETIRRLEGEMQLKEEQFAQLRDKCARIDNEKVKKQCENLSMSNKLKKLEGLLQLREDKVAELQKIIQCNVNGEATDLLEHSLYLGPDQQDFHVLQEEKDRLEEELLRQREQIFQLEKDKGALTARCTDAEAQREGLSRQVQGLMIQNENMRLSLRSQEFQKYRNDVQTSPLKKLLEEGDCLSEDDEQMRTQLEELKGRCEELQGQLKAQSQKTFEENRKALKLTSQLSYFREQLADREARYEKLRREQEQGRGQLALLQQALEQRDGQLQVQRRINAEKIKEIQTQWLQFQQDVRQGQHLEEPLDASQTGHEAGELKNSRMLLQSSFLSYRHAIGGSNHTQELEKAQDQLKQAEKMIEVQKEMEERMMSQYRGNVDRLKAEIKEKSKLIDNLNDENQHLKRKMRALELSDNKNRQKDQQLIESPTQKVIDLQAELTEMREINEKRESVEQELYNQLGEKDQEVEQLAQQMKAKERRIEELEDLLELKEVNLNSHLSVIQPKKMRESMQSHCSLRYSILSNIPNAKDKTMELDLSEVGESMVDQNQSILSNVSEVFGREEFPYQKMHLKRVEQRRLFQKTAAYIKSLKKAIDQKNRKIKLLQRKIESLRNSQLIRKDIYDVKPTQLDDLQPESEDIFRDYYSVQNENTNSQRYRIKQLEHETKLTIEENNLLSNQIESMQDELSKAEEQEDSLMKLKDLYKEEIKNLIRQNQDQLKIFEEEVRKERQKVEQADSLQRMEALKQIFMKVVSAFIAIEPDSSRSKKRDERKKELEDYLKVCCNLMSIDPQTRDKMLSDLRQSKR